MNFHEKVLGIKAANSTVLINYFRVFSLIIILSNFKCLKLIIKG